MKRDTIIIRLPLSAYRKARIASADIAAATDITAHCANVVEMYLADEEQHHEEIRDEMEDGGASHIVHSLRAIDPDTP